MSEIVSLSEIHRVRASIKEIDSMGRQLSREIEERLIHVKCELVFYLAGLEGRFKHQNPFSLQDIESLRVLGILRAVGLDFLTKKSIEFLSREGLILISTNGDESNKNVDGSISDDIFRHLERLIKARITLEGIFLAHQGCELRRELRNSGEFTDCKNLLTNALMVFNAVLREEAESDSQTLANAYSGWNFRRRLSGDYEHCKFTHEIGSICMGNSS